MPTTVNGIGTHYYGHKSPTVRHGVCQACGQDAQLESYDTRLWFVVIFIPVIPLGRKRIIDQCSACQRHYVLKADDWEMSRQLGVTGAIEKFRSDPTVDNALETHATFLGFHQPAEAQKFRQSAMEKFADDALLHAGLAIQLEELGDANQAVSLYETAFDLDPELPEARVGKARIEMQAGNLDRARELLNFVEQPGSSQLYPLAPLETLAWHYQEKGQHAEALEIFCFLLAEVPDVANHDGFRKAVQKSEKAIDVPADQRVLPKKTKGAKQPGSGSTGGKLVVGGIVVALILAGLAVFNEVTRRNRTLHVFNASNETAMVSIDGSEPVSIGRTGEISISEGAHTATISGPVDQQVSFSLSSSYFDRFFKDPAWLLNVGRGSLFSVDTIYYAANPRPSDSELLAADDFFYVPHVDYLFEMAPNELRVDSKSSVVTKIQLHEIVAPTVDLFYAVQNSDESQALSFAEQRLNWDGNDAKLVEAYSTAATRDNAKRARDFLRSGLDREPVNVAWHRAWIDSGNGEAADEEARLYYDTRLQKETDNALLLYLRGRVTESASGSRDWFARAIAADGNIPWPYLGLAYDAACRADWSAALGLLNQAAMRDGDPTMVNAYRHLAMIGTGDPDSAISDARKELNSQDWKSGLRAIVVLCDAVAAKGNADVRREFQQWGNMFMGGGAQIEPFRRSVGGYVDYMLEDFDRLTEGDQSMTLMVSLHAMLMKGRVAESIEQSQFADVVEEPENSLAVSLAFHLAGDKTQADVWRQKTIEAMRNQRSIVRSAIPLLEAETLPTLEQIDECDWSPSGKALVLASLYQRFPEAKELAQYARRLNVSRLPPYHLIQAATEPR